MNQLITPATPTLTAFGPGSTFSASVPQVLNVVGTKFLPGAVVEFWVTGGSVIPLPVTYISPTLMQFNYTGGAGAGSYNVRVRNSDGTLSTPITVVVTP
jgi:hypothetical protein